MRKLIVVSVWVIAGCGAGAPPVQPTAPAPPEASVVPPAPPGVHEDFEAATVGSMPAGWAVSGTAKDIAFAAVRGDAGNLLQIAITADGSGTIKRPLEVAPYRGKRLLVAVRASCEKVDWRARATVGIDVARPGPRGYGDRGRTGRIEAPGWQEYRALVDVAPDATALDLVVTASSASTIRLDDLRVQVLGDAGTGDEPPRALAGRALDNVIAFARLYGVVRYFHPSEEVAALDDDAWQRFVVRGIREVEGASDAASLKGRLEKLFAPIAPAVQVHPEGAAAPPTTAVASPALHWKHLGVGISKTPGAYGSGRVTDIAKKIATIVTPIDPAQVRGKELKVTLRARGKLADNQADAGLWIMEQRAGGQGFYTEPEMQPAPGAAWTDISVQGRISAEVQRLSLGIQVFGDAEVWLEAPAATVDGKPLAIPAWGRPGSELGPEWADDQQFNVEIGGKGCDRKRPCLHVSPRPAAPLDLRPWTGVLGGGVAALVPIELATRDGKAMPAATAQLPASDATPLVASDRATRLAAVIIAWNVFQHFYPYFDVVGTSWAAELPRALGAAAADAGPAALHATLRRLVYQLHDGHGSVSHAGEDTSRTAPWLWEWVEGKLVITQVSEQCACDLAPGDVVTAIDGVPAGEAAAAVGALTPAATEQHRSHVVLRRLRAGPEGGRRRLTVERNGAPRDVTVALVEPGAAPIEKRPASGDELAPGIRYVDIDRVTNEEWTKLLPVLASARAIVCDVRGYPNKISLTTPLAHFTRKTLRSARWNIPTPARPDREGMTFFESGWQVAPLEPHLGNVVFLTDGRAVSAAETYMGIVEAYKLGPIVGGPTAGTNGNINPFTVPGGYLLWWTGMKVLKHDRSRHHGVGILPTVPASRTVAGVAAGRDEVLERGIEVAQQLSKTARPARR